MLLGTQFSLSNDDFLKRLAQLGVNHVCVNPPGHPGSWSYDDLMRHKEYIESFGLILEMVQLPLPSSPIEKQTHQDILLGRSPGRDKQIDEICLLIENLNRAAIPAAKYNLNIIGIPRTEDETGRGGSRHSAFRWENADQYSPPGIAGHISEDDNWERIDYFLSRVVPVATENKIRLACHPHDPFTPPGYKGVTRVLGTVEGLKKFVEMYDSPYHGLNFCQGSVAEMLDNPDKEIDDIIRWFGIRGKIFNVHFRNIRGHKLSFMETFPDDGDMNMARTLRVYKEFNYQHMIMPDHVPIIDGADPEGAAFAFCYGYIRGLMDSLIND